MFNSIDGDKVAWGNKIAWGKMPFLRKFGIFLDMNYKMVFHSFILCNVFKMKMICKNCGLK